MLPQQATTYYVSNSSAKYAIHLEYFVSGMLYALKNVEFIFFEGQSFSKFYELAI